MQLQINLTNSEILPALGLPRQGVVRCRRQALFLQSLRAVLISFATARLTDVNFNHEKESTMIKEIIMMVFIFLALVSIPANILAVPLGKSITWEGGGQGTVKFEGNEHSEKGYKCESCHPSLFQKKKGSAKMTMALLDKGEYCGYCHNGKVAFSSSDPKKCHECHKTKNKHHDKKDNHHD